MATIAPVIVGLARKNTAERPMEQHSDSGESHDRRTKGIRDGSQPLGLPEQVGLGSTLPNVLVNANRC